MSGVRTRWKPRNRFLWVTLLAATIIVAIPGCASFQIRRLQADRAALGDRLYVEIVGRGDDEIVFLPGLMGSTAYWRSIDIRELAEHHRLIFVDLLGFGRSPWPESKYTVDDQVLALRRTLIASGATRRVTFVAHSFGTIIAANYAERYPDDVQHLFLFGVPMFADRRDAAARIGAMSPLAALMVRSRVAGRVVCTLHNAFLPMAQWSAPRLRPELPRAVASDGALHFWPSLYGSVERVILSKPIQVPLKSIGPKVTIVMGARDTISDIQAVERVVRSIGASLERTSDDHSSYWRTFEQVIIKHQSLLTASEPTLVRPAN